MSASLRSILLTILIAIASVTSMTRLAHAEDEVEAFARIIVDEVELRSGPGVTYRVVISAKRGQTFVIDGRPSHGFWLKVILPDGRIAYVIGDAVEPFVLDSKAEDAPSRPGILAPPPLDGAHAGLAIVGGVLRIPVQDGSTSTFGYLEARPSWLVHKSLSIDAFIGDSLTADGSQIFYGGGATVYLFPSWVICPFLGIGGGGLSIFPNADSFVLKRENLFIGRAGGGVLFALKNRILVRLEASNMTLFTEDTHKNAQTFGGGLGVYF